MKKAAAAVVAAVAPVYDSASATMGLHKIYVKGRLEIVMSEYK